MTRPIVMDVIARDNASRTFRQVADSQTKLAKQTDALTRNSDNLRKSQLGLIVAQERYNKVAKDSSASVGKLASAQKSLITAQQRVAAETRKATAETEKFAKTADHAHGKFNPLVDSALLLGPALVPVAAGAVAAGAGLAGMGAAGLLAFKGIQREMKQGTGLGKQYQATFAPVVDEFHQLEHIAASNVFGGINKGIQESRSLFPQVNQDIGVLSTHMGNIAGSTGAGLVALFHDLNPLFLSMADALDQGAGAFQRWATTSDVPKKFVAYAQTQLPRVEALFRDLATAVLHIGEAAAPIGSVLLPALSGIAQAIARIPTPVLTAMIVAFEVGRLGAIARGLEAVSVGLRMIGVSAGVANPIIAGVTILLGAWAVAQGQAAQQGQALTQATNDVTAALQTSNGVFNDSVRQQLAKTAADTGGTKSLDELGLSQAQYFDALMSGKDAQNAEIQRIVDRAKALGLSKSKTIELLGPLTQQVNAVQQGTDKWNAEAKAMGNAGVAIDAQSTALKGSNLTLGEAMQKYNDAFAAAHTLTAELGYMSNALDTLSNNNINATLQQDQLNLAMGTAADKFAGARKQVADHGTALRGNTDNAIANRDWALQQIQAINQQALSYAKSTGSVDKGTDALKTNEAALRTSMAQAGFTKGEIDKLITTYAATPGDIKTSVTEQGSAAVLASLGEILNQLHAIADPVWGAKFDFAMNNPSLNREMGKQATGARGGLLNGPGTGTSDSIPAWLSTGEYVVNAAATQKHLALLENINANKYAFGGQVGRIAQVASIRQAAGLPGDLLINTQGLASEVSQFNPVLFNALHAAAKKNAAQFAPVGVPAPGNISALQQYAFSLFGKYGWGSGALGSLIALWNGESGWNPNAVNQSSGAWGIPQSLPADKMASAGADWRTNGATQIRWGLDYIASVYGSPTNAYSAWLSRSPHWYRQGAWNIGYDQLAGLHRGEMVIPAKPAEQIRAGVGGTQVGPINIAVYAAAGMDEDKVARQAVAELARWVEDRERRAAKGARA